MSTDAVTESSDNRRRSATGDTPDRLHECRRRACRTCRRRARTNSVAISSSTPCRAASSCSSVWNTIRKTPRRSTPSTIVTSTMKPRTPTTPKKVKRVNRATHPYATTAKSSPSP
eukprot:86324-Rhodomonas_salina.5